MDYIELDEYAHFASDPNTIEQLFLHDEGLSALDAIKDDSTKARLRAKIISQLQQTLEEIQQLDKNQPEGELKVIVKKHHIQLRKGIFNIVRLAIPLALKAALVGIGAGDGVDLITKGSEAVISTKELIQKLDVTELGTCEAILRAIARKKPLVLTVHQASLAEIQQIFKDDPELIAPENLNETLADLTQRSVLTKTMIEKITYYNVVF